MKEHENVRIDENEIREIIEYSENEQEEHEPSEIEHIEEFMVFDADGTLISHNVINSTDEQEPIPFTYNEREFILFDDEGALSNLNGEESVRENLLYEDEPQPLPLDIDLDIVDEVQILTEEVIYDTTEYNDYERVTEGDVELLDLNDSHLIDAQNVVLNVSAFGWQNIPAGGWTSTAVSVTSNATWNLSRNVTWLNPTIGLGNFSGNRSFHIQVMSNPSTASRNGTVTVRAGNITRNISFHQFGAVPQVTLTVSDNGWINIPAGGWTSPAVNVTSNINWNLSRNVTWLNPTIGLGNFSGNRSFHVQVMSNPSTASRSGTLTVSGGNITRTMSYQQFGAAPAPILTVSTGGWNGITANGWNSNVINVTSNTNWNLSRNVTWLNPSIGLGSFSGNRSFTVNVLGNTSTTARSGTLTVSSGNITRTIAFNQLAQTPAVNLTVSPGGWGNIPSAGWNSNAVNVTSNSNWNLSRNVTWLNPSIGLGSFSGNRSFTVNVLGNTSTIARSGTLTVSSGNITRTITFNQLAAPIISTVTLNPNGGTPSNNVVRTVQTGSSLGSFPEVRRNGHAFVGWFTSSLATGGTQVFENTLISGNMTLWARWNTSVDITFPAENQVVDVANLTVRFVATQGASLTLFLRNLTTNPNPSDPQTISNRTVFPTSNIIQQHNLIPGHRYRLAIRAVLNGVTAWSMREFSVAGGTTYDAMSREELAREILERNSGNSSTGRFINLRGWYPASGQPAGRNVFDNLTDTANGQQSQTPPGVSNVFLSRNLLIAILHMSDAWDGIIINALTGAPHTMLPNEEHHLGVAVDFQLATNGNVSGTNTSPLGVLDYLENTWDFRTQRNSGQARNPQYNGFRTPNGGVFHLEIWGRG